VDCVSFTPTKNCWKNLAATIRALAGLGISSRTAAFGGGLYDGSLRNYFFQSNIGCVGGKKIAGSRGPAREMSGGVRQRAGQCVARGWRYSICLWALRFTPRPRCARSCKGGGDWTARRLDEAVAFGFGHTLPFDASLERRQDTRRDRRGASD